MDLTVLVIGLRNHQISSIECFFKIQIQSFSLSQQQDVRQSLSGDQRRVQNQCLYNGWKEVFAKLNNVISVNIKDKNGRQFGHQLARLGLQACNQLLDVVMDSEYDIEVIQYKDLFTQLFIDCICLIRQSIKIFGDNISDDLILNDSKEDISEFKFSKKCTKSDVHHVLTQAVHSNSLVLGQHWLKKYKHVDISWPQIVKHVISIGVEFIKSKNFDDLNKILCQLGIEFNDLTVGSNACQRVLLYYKISCILGRDYLDIEGSETNDLQLLKSLILFPSKDSNALSLAKELIAINDITDDDIASIISFEIMLKLKNESEEFEKSKDSSYSNLMELSSSFLSMIRLLNDTTVLGTKLLSETESLQTDPINNFVLTKLYIKAHECFTNECDVKGIALVLRKTRIFITQSLLPLKDFDSILRLMTGIGRYSEMTYCFDLFRENNQFELLLSKRIEKAPQLRIALLDYLKGDKEVFPLVALRFCLFREIAENHEMSAKKQFNQLKHKLGTNLLSYGDQLETIMYELIDAHECFSKAGCHSQADSCGKLAQLISLQIHYLPNNVLLVNMNSEQISQFIENSNNFFEALIVADAYQYNTSWVSAVFRHVVLNNDWNYWNDYISARDIGTSFIEELIQKYFHFIANQNIATERMIQLKKSVQRLIQYIDDYELRFRMSSKLNLNDFNHQMLNEESGAYLHDLRRNGLL
ncbi:spatacsin-like [Oppia nitens]|uniref:spatacsin-like n=1 Tax=Oppia nitens TaxID=1686743 RepID=UPI0023DC40B0|nr:spatacsin-like [Oppia nitens]